MERIEIKQQGTFRQCVGCSEWFVPNSPKQIFHSRKCFLAYWLKNRKQTKFPLVICECGVKTQLDFFPLSADIRWKNWRCPACGKNPRQIKREKINNCAIV